jgi:hypothetical protein
MILRIRLGLFSLVLLSSMLAACGGDDVTPPPPDVDAGDDAATDSGSDAAIDGGSDAGIACAAIDVDGDGESSCTDCDDVDSSRYHGATELCDGDDEDCDDTTFGPDGDGDGFVSIACCNGAGNCGSDCEDTDSTVHPGVSETCDGIDNDCNGTIDEGVCLPCATGYTGFDGTCTDIDECAVGSFCGTGSTGCSNSPGTFACSCGAGFVADAPTGALCHDLDECAGAANPCGALGTCTNTTGSYACGCPTGYELSGSGCVNVNECARFGPCGSAGTCADTEGSYTCTCAPGYAAGGVGGGGTCGDINECAAATSPCGMGASGCVNSVGSYACTCNAGYEAPPTGGACTDIDECVAGTPCGAGRGACSNLPGTYACACRPGYAAPATGGTCADVDECALGTDTCTDGPVAAVCTNTVGFYFCTCPAGYGGTGNGAGGCADINECTAGTHDCDTSPLAVCTNTVGSFTCTCSNGWSTASAGHGAAGCATTRFTDLLDGTVRDNANGAVWQQTIPSGSYRQAGAIAYCASLALDGGGWRLPTRDELLSIVDTTRTNPAIDPTYFPGTPTSYFWSSSPVDGTPSWGWYVYFYNGSTSYDDALASYYVRCMR